MKPRIRHHHGIKNLYIAYAGEVIDQAALARMSIVYGHGESGCLVMCLSDWTRAVRAGAVRPISVSTTPSSPLANA